MKLGHCFGWRSAIEATLLKLYRLTVHKASLNSKGSGKGNCQLVMAGLVGKNSGGRVKSV